MPDRHEVKRAAIAKSLEQRSGRSLDEWVAIANGAPSAGFMELVAWLKAEHGLGHFQARLIAEERRDRASAAGR